MKNRKKRARPTPLPGRVTTLDRKTLRSISEDKGSTSVTVIILNFMREKQLKYALPTLVKQSFGNLNVDFLIINDGLPGECERIAAEYNVPVVFTGQRNLKKMHWRCMGFAANVGIKQAKGKYIVITEAEIYHVGNTIWNLVQAARSSRKSIGIPSGMRDKGNILVALKKGLPFKVKGKKINTKAPYTWAVKKEHAMAIGGFDEDYLGRAADDRDFTERMVAYGCRFYLAPIRIVHLYHTRNEIVDNADKNASGRRQYNLNVHRSKRGTIVRNQGRDWGRLEGQP